MSSQYLLARQVPLWSKSNSMKLIAHYVPGPQNVAADQLSCHERRVVVPSPSHKESFTGMGDSGSELVCLSFKQETSVVLLSSS